MEEDHTNIKTNDSALVLMKPLKPMSCETFLDYPPLGRFAIRDMKKTVAVGVIKEVTKKNNWSSLYYIYKIFTKYTDYYH